jgi:hypothetical protein
VSNAATSRIPYSARNSPLTAQASGSTVRLVLSLLTDLRDFVARHRPCGQLTVDATEPEADGYMVTVRCPCGVWFMSWVTPGEATRELVLSELLASES